MPVGACVCVPVCACVCVCVCVSAALCSSGPLSWTSGLTSLWWSLWWSFRLQGEGHTLSFGVFIPKAAFYQRGDVSLLQEEHSPELTGLVEGGGRNGEKQKKSLV